MLQAVKEVFELETDGRAGLVVGSPVIHFIERESWFCAAVSGRFWG